VIANRKLQIPALSPATIFVCVMQRQDSMHRATVQARSGYAHQGRTRLRQCPANGPYATGKNNMAGLSDTFAASQQTYGKIAAQSLPRILFITTALPAEGLNGGELWTQTVVDSLRRNGANVQIIGFERVGSLRGRDEISVGSRTIETRQAPLRAFWWGLRALGGRPYTVEKWRSRSYARCLSTLMSEQRWDLVVIDHAQMAWAAHAIENIPFIYLSHQVESAVFRALARSVRGVMRKIYSREAVLMARLEGWLVRSAREVWCISEADSASLTRFGNEAVRRLPPLARSGLDSFPVTAHGPDVVLLGNWRWEPNALALNWFLQEVRPLLPLNWQIDIGGAVDVHRQPAMEGVRFRGVVVDAPAFLRSGYRVAVPSLAVAGANLKLLDAIASGRPVVASQRAIELIGAVPADVCSASTAADFAAALIATHPADLVARRQWMESRQAGLDAQIAAALASLLTSQRSVD
jgi:hypothetical protein